MAEQDILAKQHQTVTHDALPPTNSEPVSPVLPETFRYGEDFSLDLHLLSFEEQVVITQLRAKVEARRTALQAEGEHLMNLRGTDMLTALANAGDDIEKQRRIVDHFVRSTAKTMSPDQIRDIETIVDKTLRRIRGLGFRGAMAASKRLIGIKDQQIQQKEATIQRLEADKQAVEDAKNEVVADGTLFAMAVENAFDNLNGAYMGDVDNMELVEEARQAAEAAMPEVFKVATGQHGRISTGELETMASRVLPENEDKARRGAYPQAVGGQALIDALSLARPTSEY